MELFVIFLESKSLNFKAFELFLDAWIVDNSTIINKHCYVSIWKDHTLT